MKLSIVLFALLALSAASATALDEHPRGRGRSLLKGGKGGGGSKGGGSKGGGIKKGVFIGAGVGAVGGAAAAVALNRGIHTSNSKCNNYDVSGYHYNGGDYRAACDCRVANNRNCYYDNARASAAPSRACGTACKAAFASGCMAAAMAFMG